MVDRRMRVMLVWLTVACAAPVLGPDVSGPGRDEIRYYDRETFTVVATHRGAMTGTTTTYVREWGRRQAIVNDMLVSAGDLTYPYRNRIVMENGRIVTIDEAGVATGQTVADFEQHWAEWRGRSAMERFEFQMPNAGMRRTGASGAFAGQPCEYWEAPSIGMRDCITSWALTLYESDTLANFVAETVASEVRMGDGGPDSAFAYDPATVTEKPMGSTDDFPQLNCEQRGSVLHCSAPD